MENCFYGNFMWAKTWKLHGNSTELYVEYSTDNRRVKGLLRMSVTVRDIEILLFKESNDRTLLRPIYVVYKSTQTVLKEENCSMVILWSISHGIP